MLDQMIAGENEMTLDNYEAVIDGLKSFSDEVQAEYIRAYEEQDLLNYEQIDE